MEADEATNDVGAIVAVAEPAPLLGSLVELLKSVLADVGTVMWKFTCGVFRGSALTALVTSDGQSGLSPIDELGRRLTIAFQRLRRALPPGRGGKVTALVMSSVPRLRAEFPSLFEAPPSFEGPAHNLAVLYPETLSCLVIRPPRLGFDQL